MNTRGAITRLGKARSTALLANARSTGTALLGERATRGIAIAAGALASPLSSRLLWPLLMRKMFGPDPVPEKFERFPKEMAVRPSQLWASAAESCLMIPDTAAYRKSYADLHMPVVIIAGGQDRMVDIDRESIRRHRDIQQSAFHRVRGAGHMVHQTATRDVMAAIDQAAHAAA